MREINFFLFLRRAETSVFPGAKTVTQNTKRTQEFAYCPSDLVQLRLERIFFLMLTDDVKDKERGDGPLKQKKTKKSRNCVLCVSLLCVKWRIFLPHIPQDPLLQLLLCSLNLCSAAAVCFSLSLSPYLSSRGLRWNPT